MTQLQGFDIANVNVTANVTSAQLISKVFAAGSFVICKTTEGLGFVDGYHDEWVAQARAAGKLVGHYHYAHLTNGAAAEADFFVNHAKPQPGDVMALDFEPYGQPVQDSTFAAWMLMFCRRVTSLTGAQCWVYLNDDMANRAIAAGAQADCDAMRRELPLWKATAVTTSAGSLHGWSTFTAWQYPGQGLDADTFYGDAAAWRALGVAGPQDATHGTTPQDATHGTPQDAPVQEDAMTPELAARLDQIVAWEKDQFAAVEAKIDQRINDLAQWTRDDANSIRSMTDPAKIAAAIPPGLAQAVIDALGVKLTH